MEGYVRDFWRGRLGDGRIFYEPRTQQSDIDWKLRGDRKPDWPTYVGKDSFYKDFCTWMLAGNRTVKIPMSEFYRMIEPYLYTYGQNQTRRMTIVGPKHVGDGRVLSGKSAKTFFALPHLDVMRAAFNLRTTIGTPEQKKQWQSTIDAAAANFR